MPSTLGIYNLEFIMKEVQTNFSHSVLNPKRNTHPVSSHFSETPPVPREVLIRAIFHDKHKGRAIKYSPLTCLIQLITAAVTTAKPPFSSDSVLLWIDWQFLLKLPATTACYPNCTQCLFEHPSPQSLLDSKPYPSQICQGTLDWLV